MKNILFLLVGGVAGYIAKGLFGGKNESSSPVYFHIFARTKDWSKINMKFYTYDDAKKMYDKMVASKKLKYKDLIEYDWDEAKLFQKWKDNPGEIPKEEMPKVTDESKIHTISLVQFDSAGKEYVFEEKEWKW